MKILLCVTGSVSCILADKIAAKLSALGEVKIALTKSAQNFLNQDNFKFEGEVYTDEDELNWKKRGDSIPHIDLSKWADILVIAPLTANTLATIAAGMATNLVTNIVRAWDFNKPFIAACAMNPQMLTNPFTESHQNTMRKLGVSFVPPQIKKMMCGDVGAGALADIDKIFKEVLRTTYLNQRKAGAVFANNLLGLSSNWSEVDISEVDTKNRMWLSILETSHNAKIYGGYLEDRSPLFDERHDKDKVIHLGMDFWVSERTQVWFPYNSGRVIGISPNSNTKGGWGNRVDILIEVNGVNYVAIFAHLSSENLAEAGLSVGAEIHKAKLIGRVGKYEENGGWRPHLHLQVITEYVYYANPDFDAYCAKDDAEMLESTIHPIYLKKIKKNA